MNMDMILSEGFIRHHQITEHFQASRVNFPLGFRNFCFVSWCCFASLKNLLFKNLYREYCYNKFSPLGQTASFFQQSLICVRQ